MELKFTRSERTLGRVDSALFLGAVFCMILGTVGAMTLLPLGMVGASLALLPKISRKNLRYGPLAVLALVLFVRFRPILDGFKLLANGLFARSQETQAYIYDYFTTYGESSAEAVLWAALLCGWLCVLWRDRFTLGLCAAWAGVMAYFGVTAEPWALAVVLFFGLLTALPKGHRWFYGIILGILVLALAASCAKMAPNPWVSRLDEHLRDELAFQAYSEDQTPVPSEMPEPEILPPAQAEQEQPDHGVQRRLINVLFLALAALTLAILFIPAVIRDRAAKRAERNREGLYAPDHGEAIRAMYLYAMRWRALEAAPEPVPHEIYAIWQEAAFSGHNMEERQRESVRSYMEKTAKGVWDKANWKRRLAIRYRLCL